MLHPRGIRGGQEFMASDPGLGVFVTQCGANRVMLHQAANEGYRGLFAVVYDGPDAGSGLVSVALADDKAMLANVAACRHVLGAVRWQGLAPLASLPSIEQFGKSGLAQAEIVNQGYRQLLFALFQPDLAEDLAEMIDADPALRSAPEGHGGAPVLHARTAIDAMRDARYLSVTNQGFAQVMNLVRQTVPRFDVRAFGRHGKLMDSW